MKSDEKSAPESLIPSTDLHAVGVVIIGRNEGERLKKCLTSVVGSVAIVVYVDSGSTDNSVAIARSQNVTVIELNMRIPFTAGRARNAGVEQMLAISPRLEYVQFVDGDCELNPHWMTAAHIFLKQRPEVAAVSGRLRERYPDKSVYNMLCDLEWDAPIGEATMCGGLAMMRVDAFAAAGGFNATLICGEEPELCSRFRASGLRIWRLAEPMGLHDANMTRFGQWWVRAMRSGFSDAQAFVIDSAPPVRRGLRSSLSTWLWGGVIPLTVVLLTLWWPLGALCLLFGYPIQIARLATRKKRSASDNWWRAFFLLLGKFPEMQGQIKYYYQRLRGKPSNLIEHK